MSKPNQILFKDFVTLQRGFDLPANKRVEGEYPVVAATSINGYHNQYKVEPPGVVTGRSGALGEVQYIETKFWALNTTLWVKDFKGNLPKYVYYFLKTLDLKRFNSGAGVPTLNRNDLDTLEIKIHDYSSQCRIASILSAYDDLIENNTRRIKILEEMAELLYREWFVNFRFPGYQQVPMVESELGLIPQGWATEKLGNHITTQKGFAFKSTWYQDVGVPIVKVSNFTDDSVDIMNLTCVSEEIAQQYKKYKLSSNEIIIQTVGSWASNPQSVVGKVIRIPRLAEGSLLNQNAVKILPLSSINETFLFYSLKTQEFKSYIIGCGQGAASQASITLDAIKAFSFLLPSDYLLQSFQTVVYPIWELINALRMKNLCLQKTRNLLLPKLISGEIDVESLDSATETDLEELAV